MFVGCGGGIPFMNIFGDLFPESNFILTGCGFTESNAHSANESLNLEFCRKLTSVIAELLATLH
jgi:acetylornithine deacetylase/succinyl-diaminopimelate desuccinylase-like protein